VEKGGLRKHHNFQWEAGGKEGQKLALGPAWETRGVKIRSSVGEGTGKKGTLDEATVDGQRGMGGVVGTGGAVVKKEVPPKTKKKTINNSDPISMKGDKTEGARVFHLFQ